MTRIDRFKKIEIKLGTKYISVLLYLTWVKNDIFFFSGQTQSVGLSLRLVSTQFLLNWLSINRANHFKVYA